MQKQNSDTKTHCSVFELYSIISMTNLWKNGTVLQKRNSNAKTEQWYINGTVMQKRMFLAKKRNSDTKAEQ